MLCPDGKEPLAFCVCCDFSVSTTLNIWTLGDDRVVSGMA